MKELSTKIAATATHHKQLMPTSHLHKEALIKKISCARVTATKNIIFINVIKKVSLKMTNRPVVTIEKEVSLNTKNWFQTGGQAAYFAEPTTDQALLDCLEQADKYVLPITIMGAGANILCADGVIPSFFIRPQLDYFSSNLNEKTVTVGAALSIEKLIEKSLDKQLSGFEDFAGIPGTVGGALFINLHYFSRLIGDNLVTARVIDRLTKTTITVTRDWFSFGYNQSRLQEIFFDQKLNQEQQRFILIDATFTLNPVTSDSIAFQRGRIHEIIKHRNRRYPTARTCGSFFRNFYPEEVAHLPSAIPFVAYYLDLVGARRLFSQGPVTVFHGHANMLVTHPGATSADIIAVARELQRLVYEQWGLLPQPECRLIGFSDYPLLKTISCL